MAQDNKMGTMAMPRLVLNMAWPLMISLLIQSLYNIVDSIFVARLSESALTAVSLAYPVQILMLAVSIGTSVGINALLSRSIGEKDMAQTRNGAATGVILALAGTVLFMLIGIFGSRGIARMFTSDVTIQTYCSQYLSICLLFCVGSFISIMYQRFLQAVGDTFDSMLSLVFGAVTNLILDPILIFGLFGLPALEVRGAAIATVIGQWVSAITAMLLNKYRIPQVEIRFRGYHISKQVLGKIYKVGLPTIITQALATVMLTCVNKILIVSSSTAVAFFGVYYKLQSFLFMPMNGLGQAAIPIAGYNYGAKRYDRLRDLLKTSLPMAIGIALVITIVFEAIPRPLLMCFSASEDMLAIGIPALRIISVTIPLASVTMVLGYTNSGLGSGVVNMLGTALRQFLVLIPILWLLSWSIGMSAAWYAFWVAEVAAVVYAVLAARHQLRKRHILGPAPEG